MATSNNSSADEGNFRYIISIIEDTYYEEDFITIEVNKSELNTLVSKFPHI